MAKNDSINRPDDFTFLMFYFAGDVDGITKVQKLLFLIEEESELAEHYDKISFDFEAYDYGPFSEQVYDSVELLVNMGALEPVEPDYDIQDYLADDHSEFAGKQLRLTEKGMKIVEELRKHIDENEEGDLKALMEKYNEMDREELLTYVYEQYPDYTDKSKIKGDILG